MFLRILCTLVGGAVAPLTADHATVASLLVMLDTDKPVGTSQVPPPEQVPRQEAATTLLLMRLPGWTPNPLLKLIPIVSQMAITHDGAAIGRRIPEDNRLPSYNNCSKRHHSRNNFCVVNSGCDPFHVSLLRRPTVGRHILIKTECYCMHTCRRA